MRKDASLYRARFELYDLENDPAMDGTLTRSAPGRERHDYAERLAPASPKPRGEGG